MKRIIAIMLLLLCLAGCHSGDYYADEANYITAVGPVCHIQYTDDGEELYLGISGLGSEFADVNFRIIGDSLTSDIYGGNNAGIHTCWFNPKGKPLAEGITANYIAGNFDEVLRVIEKGAL